MPESTRSLKKFRADNLFIHRKGKHCKVISKTALMEKYTIVDYVH